MRVAALLLISPLIHGYDVTSTPAEDVSALAAAGWAWASGGMVATPADVTRFIRAYAGGENIDAAARAAQFSFGPGNSEPRGPGENTAGLALCRYTTRCGTMYGHTANIFGYTQFAAASEDGQRSVIVAINAQITNGDRFLDLRNIYELGVCAAFE